MVGIQEEANRLNIFLETYMKVEFDGLKKGQVNKINLEHFEDGIKYVRKDLLKLAAFGEIMEKMMNDLDRFLKKYMKVYFKNFKEGKLDPYDLEHFENGIKYVRKELLKLAALAEKDGL